MRIHYTNLEAQWHTVSVLDFESGGLNLWPGQVFVLCSWARLFTFIVPQEYKKCWWTMWTTTSWGITYNELAFHPGGVPILLVNSSTDFFQLYAACQKCSFNIHCNMVQYFLSHLSFIKDKLITHHNLSISLKCILKIWKCCCLFNVSHKKSSSASRIKIIIYHRTAMRAMAWRMVTAIITVIYDKNR